MSVSILVFTVAIVALYLWTKKEAASAPLLPEDHIEPPREMAPR
jgi:hypothetical protein